MISVYLLLDLRNPYPELAFLDYFVIKGKGRNPFWGFLPLCYWCVVIVCTI